MTVFEGTCSLTPPSPPQGGGEGCEGLRGAFFDKLRMRATRAPLCNLVGVPMALIVRPNAPYKTIPELFAKEASGLKFPHAPYRGGAAVSLLGSLAASAGKSMPSTFLPTRGSVPFINLFKLERCLMMT